MLTTAEEILKVLQSLDIEVKCHGHEPVFTVEESKEIKNHLPGCHTKNLFLKDKKGKIALVFARDETRVDLKALAKQLGTGTFSFGNPQLLEETLGIKPGSVTPLALINDKDKQTVSQFVIEKDILECETVNCHPLVNTATVNMTLSDFQKFIAHCGHKTVIIPLPTREK